MKINRVTIYPIDNAYILDASDLRGSFPSLTMMFTDIDEAFKFAKDNFVTPEDIKAEREKAWHPVSNSIPNSVMSKRGSSEGEPDI